MDKKKRIEELTELLNRARHAYEQEDRELMSNFEYDRLYDELEALEKETGIQLSDSPTVNVGYEALSSLPKEAHASPMLSLNKTKSREELAAWLGSHEGLLSWKMDGITVVLTYENGELLKAVTRGNGMVGEVITQNARGFVNLPLKLAFGGRLVVRGEAVISYADFERINAELPETEVKYKNPRNLCSGSVRQLDSRIAKRRRVHFIAFTLVEAEGKDFSRRSEQLDWLDELGFESVGRLRTGKELNLQSAIDDFAGKIEENAFPSDGLVLSFDDIEYGRSLGRTAKFPRDSIAFKWQDETAETTLREVEWSASRTGLINPVAIFDPVELEGTEVSRASVHNVSIARQLKLGIGDCIRVYKANMIIPQIAENLTKSGSLEIPTSCPVCGGRTEIRSENDSESLYCTNPGCPAKKIKAFVHFAGRDAMNIEGLSEMTLEKFIAEGFVHEYSDLFKLERFSDEITQLEGFGEKSFAKLVAAAEKARHTTPARLLYALGVPNIGVANARLLARHCGGDWEKLSALRADEMLEIDGVGEVMAQAYAEFFADAENRRQIAGLLEMLEFESVEEVETERDLEGLTFVITGSLEHFSNRKELQELIERRGGKAAGSVSAKTDFLINNDKFSQSAKNRTAQSLGIAIISEEEFIERFARR